MKGLTGPQLKMVADMLGERLDICVMEVAIHYHKHSGQQMSPAALHELRNRVSWHIGLSAAAVLNAQLSPENDQTH